MQLLLEVHRGGRPDLFNMFTDIDEDQCCIYVALFSIKFGTRYKMDDDGFTRKSYCFKSFEGFIGIPSRLDIQFYNELGNTEEENKNLNGQYYILLRNV